MQNLSSQIDFFHQGFLTKRFSIIFYLFSPDSKDVEKSLNLLANFEARNFAKVLMNVTKKLSLLMVNWLQLCFLKLLDLI